MDQNGDLENEALEKSLEQLQPSANYKEKLDAKQDLHTDGFGWTKRFSRSVQEEEFLVKSLPSEVRNIGIVAHIDAGKTTVTERMLYLAGVIRNMGDVDSGNTVTDFLDMERERGITIQLAAITFPWKKHRINLIDTPGHVDFTVEVERCTRVLDGIITVLDGSSGVQAQTLTVWRQAAKFRLPSSFFINKLDKKEANFERSVDSVEQKLGIKALVTTLPYFENQRLSGVVDVIAKRFVSFHTDGQWSSVEVRFTLKAFCYQ
ncbi:GTP-binding domain protein [Necator americanus]|uniref:GTP-binding domain protein n=1 Tax=Necator americanus TaxID=51031 RepID=W2TMZ9_NECAM|nr:GTP-binding domain protein [Necator americanus]ETN83148.1 GTP-binding domain protein [Necator americanus]